MDFAVFMGLCSTIVTMVCGGIVVDTETLARDKNKRLKQLIVRADQALIMAMELQKQHKEMEEYLTMERKIIGQLGESLNSANYNLDLSETVFMNNIPTLRRNYIKALDDLYLQAQKYLEQEELKLIQDGQYVLKVYNKGSFPFIGEPLN